MSKIIADHVSKTRELIKGLRKNVELVKDKGISPELLNQLEADSTELFALDKDTDKRKEEVRTQVRLINRKLACLKEQVKETKKIIKANYDKESWKEFGVVDKR